MAFRCGITRSLSHVVRASKRSPQVIYGASSRFCASTSSLDEPGNELTNFELTYLSSHK